MTRDRKVIKMLSYDVCGGPFDPESKGSEEVACDLIKMNLECGKTSVFKHLRRGKGGNPPWDGWWWCRISLIVFRDAHSCSLMKIAFWTLDRRRQYTGRLLHLDTRALACRRTRNDRSKPL